MVISLKCKDCKGDLQGEGDEFGFLCERCRSLFILKNDTLREIDTYLFDNNLNMDFLLPLYLFKTNIEYIDFTSKKQNDVAITMGNRPLIVVRGISMIDPIYFGDIEIETMHRLNNLQTTIRQERLAHKIFHLNISPEIAVRLSRYNFMKYFDRQADITGMKFNFRIESLSLFFLKAKRDGERIYISELATEIPAYSIITV